MQTDVAVHSVRMLDLPLFKRFSSVLMYSIKDSFITQDRNEHFEGG